MTCSFYATHNFLPVSEKECLHTREPRLLLKGQQKTPLLTWDEALSCQQEASVLFTGKTWTARGERWWSATMGRG